MLISRTTEEVGKSGFFRRARGTRGGTYTPPRGPLPPARRRGGAEIPRLSHSPDDITPIRAQSAAGAVYTNNNESY